MAGMIRRNARRLSCPAPWPRSWLLPLPAGSWAIFAKADTSTQGGGPVELHCTLIAGTSVDHTDPELEAGGTAAFTENIALNVAHRFSGPGSASLFCNSSGVTVDVSSIKITAIKAGTMTMVGMRYALDIPYIARENSTAEILALRKAWTRAAG